MDISLALMFLGGIIFVGFISSLLFNKTRIPDSIILIAIGLLLRRAELVDPAMLEPFTALVASVAISIILFESGMSIDLSELASGLSHAFNMANLSYISSALIIGLLTNFLLGWNPLISLMVGFLLGGTSGEGVTPLARQLLIPENTVVAELESTLTNIYNFVFSVSIANIILSVDLSPNYALNNLLSYFSIGVFLGIVVGFVWIKLARKLWSKPFSYITTLSIVFMLYGFAEYAGGSGAIAGLVFGLVLGNSKEIAEIIKAPKVGTSRLLKFSQEIAFLIRTYFFLFLGTILEIPRNPYMWGLAGAVAVVSVLARLLWARVLGLPQKMALLIPRGINEVVISSIVMGMGVTQLGDLLNLVGLVIIVTNLLPAVIQFLPVPKPAE